MSDQQRSTENKKLLFGKFGSKATGISPTVCWPTRTEVDEQREWEALFYDGVTSTKERIDRAKAEERKEKEDMLKW